MINRYGIYYYSKNEDFKPWYSIIAIGKFDAFHKGHRKLINCLKEKHHCQTTMLLTFDFENCDFLESHDEEYLYSLEEKKHIVDNLDIDGLAIVPFTKEFANLSPDEFFKEIVCTWCSPMALVVGEDFRFGKNRIGDVAKLKKICDKSQIPLIVLDKEYYQGKEVSSTWIRELIRKGKIELANILLESPYFIMGKVIHGKGLGSKALVPTINIKVDEKKVLPPNGVYATRVTIGDKVYKSITNIGINPTVNEPSSDTSNIKKATLKQYTNDMYLFNRRVVETNIFDFDDALYDQEVIIEFLSFIRSEMKFSSIKELKTQIEKDIKFVKEHWKEF